jgi:hypothetical protein
MNHNPKQLQWNIIEGLRPDIPEGTLLFHSDLITKYWNADPKMRPTVRDICLTFESMIIT